jgi:hypothetical protein
VGDGNDESSGDASDGHQVAEVVVVLWKILLLFILTDPSLDLPLSYINRCTAHYSSVMFWFWFCLEQIKVIALAHLAIISTVLHRGQF